MAVNFTIVKRKNDNVFSMLRRFKKLTKETGIIEEYKSKQVYEKPSKVRYRKRKQQEHYSKLDSNKIK